MTKFLTWLKRQQLVFLDTPCFIYTFEDHKQFGIITRIIFDALSDNKLSAVSSIITVSEVLTKSYELNRLDLIGKYQEIFLNLPNLAIIAPSYQTAVKAAQIRATYKFKLLDSFQLALALDQKCDSYLTNDRQLKKFKQLHIFCLSDMVRSYARGG